MGKLIRRRKRLNWEITKATLSKSKKDILHRYRTESPQLQRTLQHDYGMLKGFLKKNKTVGAARVDVGNCCSTQKLFLGF